MCRSGRSRTTFLTTGTVLAQPPSRESTYWLEPSSTMAESIFAIVLQISLVSEKKDNVLYNEKFSHLRFAPSVRHFGNRPTVGCIVISTTSMIGVVVVSIEGLGPAQLITTSDSLATTRQRVSAVDICYGKSTG
uniref:(California timema) hypothetical protein n=1 Tax=Timema californicum TaxID=61474 RepID=A0A7R9P427_TIMCA|nr:unnamed protein product [Timema californicum]